MPYVDPSICNSMGPVGVWNKYTVTIIPLDPSCDNAVKGGFTQIIDFNGEKWVGTSDGMTAEIDHVGTSGIYPTWQISGTQFECGGGTAPNQQLLCPPAPAVFSFSSISSLCCLSHPDGAISSGGGIPDLVQFRAFFARQMVVLGVVKSIKRRLTAADRDRQMG